jgi:aryl-alcohol dehydrogenase-like predicted oxidoreductase
MRTLGHDLDVPAIGYGAMALVHGMYGPNDDIESVKTIQHAIDVGAGFVDTSDAYGPDGHNERLIGEALKGRRDRTVVATKWGYALEGGGTPLEFNWDVAPTADGRPETAGRRIDASLARLGVEAIDLWYLHVPDPEVPIEETVGAMAEAVRAGKAVHLGLSNVTADQVRRAHATHPIAALQYEWSLLSRDIELELVPLCRELGIGIVPWAPLGAGLVTGAVSTIDADDFRNVQPRYQGDNLRINTDRFAPIRHFAAEMSISPSQLALAWLLHQGPDVVPIPGTRTSAHVEENVAAAAIELSPETLERIEELCPHGIAAGASLLHQAGS